MDSFLEEIKSLIPMIVKAQREEDDYNSEPKITKVQIKNLESSGNLSQRRSSSLRRQQKNNQVGEIQDSYYTRA